MRLGQGRAALCSAMLPLLFRLCVCARALSGKMRILPALVCVCACVCVFEKSEPVRPVDQYLCGCQAVHVAHSRPLLR